YLVTQPNIAASLKSLSMGGMNIPAMFAAEAALDDQSFYDKSLALNEEAKEQIYQTLDRMGLKYIRTHGNFVFFKSGIPIQELQSRAERLGVLVGRPFPPYNDWCRISTGTPDQTAKFCSVISTILMG
ncbi:MAG: aminotransferase class I/II-fold pyridoxal phosphate-dependent enzyme, partial [Saprospiraceae bacterium]